MSKINVLVVEDSPVVQMLLKHLLDQDPQLQVVGAVKDGQEAVEFVAEQRPDVVLMDVHMPRMDGYEATRRIMAATPVPVVIASAVMSTEEVSATFHALEAGALAFVEKPAGMGAPGFDAMVENLVQTVKLMAEVKVVRRRNHGGRPAPAASAHPPGKAVRPPEKIQVVAIGASTGGPTVIQTILQGLPLDYPAPILIVQHIAPGFLDGMADWLQQTTPLPTHLATHGTTPLPGHVYLAPDDHHLGLLPSGKLMLSKDAAENNLRPAVSYLFRSAANVCAPQTVAVLLTGMGRDGADELKILKDRGAITIAQDAKSSVVHGMPGEAIRLGAAAYTLSPPQIAEMIVSLGNGS